VDPTQKRILFDLTKDCRDKVRNAAAHMNEMCNLADIPADDMLSGICGALINVLVEIIDQNTDMSAEDFSAQCAEALQKRRVSRRRARARSS
jgi:hypothetical protein